MNMLYLYSFYDYEEEEETLSVELENIKEFKQLGEGMNYISNRNDIVVEGKTPRIQPLHEFIPSYFDGGEVLEMETDLLYSKLEIPKERAIELLCDDLMMDGSYQFNQRIWESENVYREIEDIIKELTIVVIELILDNFDDEYKRIKENGFEWS